MYRGTSAAITATRNQEQQGGLFTHFLGSPKRMTGDTERIQLAYSTGWCADAHRRIQAVSFVTMQARYLGKQLKGMHETTKLTQISQCPAFASTDWNICLCVGHSSEHLLHCLQHQRKLRRHFAVLLPTRDTAKLRQQSKTSVSCIP